MRGINFLQREYFHKLLDIRWCADLLPDQEGLGVLKRILDKDDELIPEDKEHLRMMMPIDC